MIARLGAAISAGPHRGALQPPGCRFRFRRCNREHAQPSVWTYWKTIAEPRAGSVAGGAGPLAEMLPPSRMLSPLSTKEC